MKKLSKIFLFSLFVLTISFVVAGCSKKTETTTEEIYTTVTKQKVDWDKIKVEDTTVEFDKEFHKVEVIGAPENAKITYEPDKTYRYPGTYDYKITVKAGGETKTYKVKLTITKVNVTANYDEEQVWYLSDGPAHAVVTTNQANYQANEGEYFYKAGSYKTTITFPESNIYNELDPVEINLTVKNSRSGYYLESGSYILGDDPITLTAKTEGEVDSSNYELEYKNCEFTEQGYYYSVCYVKDKDTHEVVDELRALSCVDYEENAAFATYEDEMFVYFMSGDQLSSNIFMEDYKAFGLEHSDAIWYTYEKYSDEDYESDCKEVADLRKEFDTYKTMKLSMAQKNTFDVIEKNIKHYEELFKDKKNLLMQQSYIDQFGGYCADFPTDMEAYSLRTLEDVEDMISYCNSVHDAFMSYVEYAKDREAAGYGFSEKTLSEMIKYLQGVNNKKTEYYLIEILRQKIRDAKEELSLSDDQVNTYITNLEKACENMMKGYEDLEKALQEYFDAAKGENGYLASGDFKEGYLSVYDGGKELYIALLQNRLGIQGQDMDSYDEYLDESMAAFRKKYSLFGTLSENAKAISNGTVDICGTNDPVEILEWLKEFAATIVPELESEPTISVTYMDKTQTANTTTVAYYMKSALDSKDAEFIHLNQQALGLNKLETVSTLAHEGYPGHLYAYVYSKESEDLSNLVRVMTCTGHGEGWAKYVEYALYQYIIEQHKDDEDAADWEDALLSDIYWSLYAYLLYTKIDFGIMYKGWDADEVGNYMRGQNLNDSGAQDIYQQLIEMPGQYAAYGYGNAMFYQWHEKAQTELGSHYNEINFNVAMLEHGWVGFNQLNAYLEQYINNQKFILYID